MQVLVEMTDCIWVPKHVCQRVGKYVVALCGQLVIAGRFRGELSFDDRGCHSFGRN